jgi:hypothetical protein
MAGWLGLGQVRIEGREPLAEQLKSPQEASAEA